MPNRWNKLLRDYPRAAAALLVLVTFAVYAVSLAGGFVYDDEHQILQNPLVVNPHLWRRIFAGSVWSFQNVAAGDSFYRPLQIFSYWLVYRLAGPDPGVFHLAQLLLYLPTVWLVYRLGCELLGHEVAAFTGALLWALHPLHVEAVAWIAGLPEVGFGFFYVLGFLLFLRAERAAQGQALKQGLSALAYFVALFFKEMAVSLPLVVLAYWFFQPSTLSWPKRALRFMPYIVALGGYLAIRRAALGHLVRSQGLLKFSHSVLAASLALLGEHTKLFVWPAHLSAFRSFDLAASLHSPWPWLTFLALVLALFMRKREPRLSFLMFWWPVTLMPCLDIRQLSNPLLADRFSYVPSVGLCLAIAFAVLVTLPERMPAARSVWLRSAGWATLLAAALLGTAQTRRVVSQWHDNQTLLNYSLQQAPDAAPLHIVQGWRLEYQVNDLDGATREFEMAFQLNQVSLRPMANITYDAFIGLGQVAYRKGQKARAVEYLQDAIRVLPKYAEAYQVLGSIYFPQGDYAKAAEYFAETLKWEPMSLEARFYLGSCQLKLGRYGEAAQQFRAAIAVDPTYTQAYEAEARALELAGDREGAARVRSLGRAIR